MDTFDELNGFCQEEMRFPPRKFMFAINALLFAGIFLSYLPQMINIVIKKSSHGISSYTLAISSMNSFCVALTAFLTYPDSLYCCVHYWGIGLCLKELVTPLQCAIQWVSINIILVLYLVYQNNPSKPALQEEIARDQQLYLFYWSFIGFVGFVAVMLISLSGGIHTVLTQSFLKAMAMISVVFVLVQYLPQIHKTYVNKTVGAYSLTMCFMQIPGACFWLVCLIYASEASKNTWLPLFISICLQTVLLTEGLYYDWQQGARERELKRHIAGFPDGQLELTLMDEQGLVLDEEALSLLADREVI